MEDKLSIKVSIADEFYPLKINRNEEERIRKAANLLNTKFLKYQQTFSGSKHSDFMAMVALHFATKYLEASEKLDESSIIEKLEDLNEKVNDHIDGVE